MITGSKFSFQPGKRWFDEGLKVILSWCGMRQQCIPVITSTREFSDIIKRD
jgi:hypothetical protein